MKDNFKRRDFIKAGFTFGALMLLPKLKVMAINNTLPNVLIIGDSISIGYTPFVRELLEGKAMVYRPDGNCLGTAWGVKNIDQWLIGRKYDIIHFNFGLHDLKHVDAETGKDSIKPEDPLQSDINTYANNLNSIITKLKATGAKLIFATTTPVPKKPNPPLRDDFQPKRYNKVAKKIMKKQKIAIDDLYNFALPQLKQIQLTNDVHYTKEGYHTLAQQVTSSILKVYDN